VEKSTYTMHLSHEIVIGLYEKQLSKH